MHLMTIMIFFLNLFLYLLYVLFIIIIIIIVGHESLQKGISKWINMSTCLLFKETIYFTLYFKTRIEYFCFDQFMVNDKFE